MNVISEKLQGLGLSGKASALYVALLQIGSGTVHDIASRASLIRTTCYPLLEELQRRGLVSTTKSGKRTVYVAESPQALLENLEEKSAIVHSLIPLLSHILSGNSKRPQIEIYEGTSGVWRVYNDVIAGEKYEIKAFVPADSIISLAGEKKVKDYIRKRVQKGISMRAIMQKTSLIKKEYAKYNKSDLRKSRFIDPEKFPIPVEIDLYPPHNIAITSFKDGIGLIIRSKEIHVALSSIFELTWENSE